MNVRDKLRQRDVFLNSLFERNYFPSDSSAYRDLKYRVAMQVLPRVLPVVDDYDIFSL